MPEQTTTTTTAPIAPVDHSKDLADLKSANATLLSRLDALEKSKAAPTPDPTTDSDLANKVKLDQERQQKEKAQEKRLEAALQFSIQAKDWYKTNQSLLNKNIQGILEQADKENYSSAIEKDSAIKTGIVQEFFSQQYNLDLLTPGLKTVLEDFLKLTKTSKQEKAQHVYENIFEPTFEMLKRIKKAEAISKGHAPEGDDETAYKNKMISLSKKHYLGDK